MGLHPSYVEVNRHPDDIEEGRLYTPAEMQAAVAKAKADAAAEVRAQVDGYPAPNTSGVANTTAGSPNTSDDQADSTPSIPTGIEGVNPGNEPGTSGTDGTGLDTEGEKASTLPPVAAANGLEVDHKHGDLDRPGKAGSTDAWRAYAGADPQGAPIGYETMSRDELRDLYLGNEA